MFNERAQGITTFLCIRDHDLLTSKTSVYCNELWTDTTVTIHCKKESQAQSRNFKHHCLDLKKVYNVHLSSNAFVFLLFKSNKICLLLSVIAHLMKGQIISVLSRGLN